MQQKKKMGKLNFMKNNSVHQKTLSTEGFPGGPVIKNQPYNAGDTGSIPGQGTKIPLP